MKTQNPKFRKKLGFEIFEELRTAFERLPNDTVLKNVELEDFMYMGSDSKRGYRFKHKWSRNCIYLSEGIIFVPISENPFHRGTF